VVSEEGGATTADLELVLRDGRRMRIGRRVEGENFRAVLVALEPASTDDFSLRASHAASASSIAHLLLQDIQPVRRNAGTTAVAPATTRESNGNLRFRTNGRCAFRSAM
jgi:hypothetical protein